MQQNLTNVNSTFVQLTWLMTQGAFKQQALTWANVYLDFLHHIASLGRNELRCLISIVLICSGCWQTSTGIDADASKGKTLPGYLTASWFIAINVGY